MDEYVPVWHQIYLLSDVALFRCGHCMALIRPGDTPEHDSWERSLWDLRKAIRIEVRDEADAVEEADLVAFENPPERSASGS